MTKPRSTTIDMAVGRCIRERRAVLGLTQQQLAAMIGITPQQPHKNERGINRISAGRLAMIAQALKVSVGHFFDERDLIGNAGSREKLELVRAYNRIASPDVRAQVRGLVSTIADEQGQVLPVEKAA